MWDVSTNRLLALDQSRLSLVKEKASHREDAETRSEQKTKKAAT